MIGKLLWYKCNWKYAVKKKKGGITFEDVTVIPRILYGLLLHLRYNSIHHFLIKCHVSIADESLSMF